MFSNSVWRFRDSTRERDGYLFVDADSGIMVPVIHSVFGIKGYRYFGVGLWFYEISEFEIVTTHIKSSGLHRWLHEYYRIDGDWMQWSNKKADICHDRVDDAEVPEGYREEFQRVMEKSASRVRPDYDTNRIAKP